jgi:hypothetical protein
VNCDLTEKIIAQRILNWDRALYVRDVNCRKMLHSEGVTVKEIQLMHNVTLYFKPLSFGSPECWATKRQRLINKQ